MNANRFINKEKSTILDLLDHLQTSLEGYNDIFLCLMTIRKKKVSFGESSFIEPTSNFTGFSYDTSSSTGSTTSNEPGSFTFVSTSQPAAARPFIRARPAFRGRGKNIGRLLNAFNDMSTSESETNDEEKKDSDSEIRSYDLGEDNTEEKDTKIERVAPSLEDWDNIIFPGLEQYLKDDGLDSWVTSEWMRRVRQEHAKVTDQNYVEVFHYILHHVTHGVQPPTILKYFPDDDVSTCTVLGLPVRY